MYYKYNVLLKSSDYNTLRLDLLVVLIQLVYYQNTIQVGGACSSMGERRVVCRVLVGKPEGKRPLWRPRHRWEGG